MSRVDRKRHSDVAAAADGAEPSVVRPSAAGRLWAYVVELFWAFVGVDPRRRRDVRSFPAGATRPVSSRAQSVGGDATVRAAPQAFGETLTDPGDAAIVRVLEHQLAVLEAIGLQLARVDRRLRRINRSALVRSPRSTIGVGIVLGVIFLWLFSLLIGLVVGLFMIVVGIGL